MEVSRVFMVESDDMAAHTDSAAAAGSRSEIERDVLFEITRAANQSHAVGLLIAECIHLLERLIPFDSAFALLLKPAPPGVELIEARNIALDTRFALESLASFVDETNASSASTDRPANIVKTLREYLNVRGNGAPLFIPLRSDALELGVIVLVAPAESDERAALQERDQKLFDAAGGQIGIALGRLRAANELGVSEEMFRGMVTESPNGFWETDGLGVIRYANHAALALLGRSADQVIGKRIDDISNRDPAGLRELRRQLRESDFVTGYYLNIRAADGTDRTVSQSIRVLRDANGRIKSYQGIVHDVTAHVQNMRLLERRQREADLLHELANRLNNPGNLNEALEKGLDLITTLTHTESVAVLLINPEQTAYEIVAHRGVEPDLIARYAGEPINPAIYKPEFDPAQTTNLIEYLILTRRALDLAQLFTVPRFPLQSIQDAGYQSGYIFPIGYGGQVYGAVIVASKLPQTFDVQDIQLLDNISAQLGLALQNQRLVADLKRQVLQMEAVSRAAALIQYAPRAEEGLPGVVREIRTMLDASYVVLQLLHQDHFEIVTATDTRETRRTFPIAPYEQRVLDSDEPLIVNDVDAPDVDAEQREIASRLMLRAVFAIRLYAHDHPLGVLFVNQDTPRTWSPTDGQLIRRFAQQIAEALENKRLLDENMHQLRALRALVYAGRLMTTGLSQANALHVVADEIARVFPADYVSFHLREGDQLRLVAESVEMNAPPVLPIYPHQHRVLGELITTIVNDRDQDAAHPAQRELLAQYGLVADLGVPLVTAHRALGVLYISQRSAHVWTESEIRLATLFAQQLAAALTNTRLLQDSKTQVSTLAALARSATFIGMSRSPESALPQVARDLREVLGVDYVGFHLLKGDALHIYTETGREWANVEYPVQQYHHTLLDYFQKLVVNDRKRDAKDKGHDAVLERFGMCADVSVPMVTRGKAIGILVIARRKPHLWQENELFVYEACAQQIATVLDNVQLLNDLEARVHELAGLADLNEITATIPDINVLSDLALDSVKSLLNARYVTLLLVEREQLKLFRVVSEHFGAPSNNEINVEISRELLKLSSPLLLDRNHPQNFNTELSRRMTERGLRAAIIVPLVTAQEPIGLLTFGFLEEHLFDPTETRLAQSAANQIALAFANARLIREQKTRIERLTLLSEFAHACNTVRDPQALKEMAARRICEMLDLKASSIRLVEDSQLTPDASYGFQNAPARRHAIPIDSRLQHLLSLQKPNAIPDLANDPSLPHHWRERHVAEGFCAALMVPLSVERQVIGILTLYRGETHEWSDSEVQYAQTIANTLALAIRNAVQFTR